MPDISRLITAALHDIVLLRQLVDAKNTADILRIFAPYSPTPAEAEALLAARHGRLCITAFDLLRLFDSLVGLVRKEGREPEWGNTSG
jgi:hypothetical protein